MKRVNRKQLPKWTKHLSACEIKHLANEAGGLTLANAQRNWEHAEKERAKENGQFAVCWDCLFLGRKLAKAGLFKGVTYTDPDDTPAIYIIEHCHRHGTNIHFVELTQEPTAEQVESFLGNDYEPDLDEEYTVHKIEITPAAEFFGQTQSKDRGYHLEEEPCK
jgi:hypothetical protein